MISSIEISGYKALNAVRVRLSPFQALVGPNASGKSTFFDALLLVRDILNTDLRKAVFGDTKADIALRAADPLELSWLRKGGHLLIALEADIPDHLRSLLRTDYAIARYELAIDLDKLLFAAENMWLIPARSSTAYAMQPLFSRKSSFQKGKSWRNVVRKVSDSGNDYFRSEKTKWQSLFRLGPTKSAFANLPEDEEKFPVSTWFKRLLKEGIHQLVLDAEAMRLPAPVASSAQFLADGANLPWVVRYLEEKAPERLKDWIEHLKLALDGLESIETREKPEDRSLYLVLTYANGLQAPSWLLSDGTLRLLALTVLAYTPLQSPLILIEEPENGIHPRGVQAVMQSLCSVYDSQVFCTTHSPLVLSLLKSSDLLCFAKASGGAVSITRGDQHPSLKEWQAGQHLGDLFAAGVLE